MRQTNVHDGARTAEVATADAEYTVEHYEYQAFKYQDIRRHLVRWHDYLMPTCIKTYA